MNHGSVFHFLIATIPNRAFSCLLVQVCGNPIWFVGDGCDELSGTLIATITIAALLCTMVAGFVLVHYTVLPQLDRRNSRRDAALHGRLHPLTVLPLNGDQLTVTTWGASRDLYKTIAAEHPELGDPAGFALQTTDGVVVHREDCSYGSKFHDVLLRRDYGRLRRERYNSNTSAGLVLRSNIRELVLVYIDPNELHGDDDNTAGDDDQLCLLDGGSGGSQAETRI